MDLPNLSTLSVSVEDGIAHVELNRPDKANSMSQAMWVEFESCFRWLDRCEEVRVVVLSGRGKHFCAGIDLAMFGELKEAKGDPARAAETRRQTILRLQGNLNAIEDCRKPVLAAIHYTCVGGGIDLTSCCDIRYCSADAYFSIKEIDVGMVADVGTLQRLPHIIGDGLVRELAYTGRRMEAQEAKECGFVNTIFSDKDAMLDGVMDVARSIAARSPLAIRGIKEVLLYGRDHSVADGLRYIANWNAGMMSETDIAQSVASGGNPAAVNYDD